MPLRWAASLHLLGERPSVRALNAAISACERGTRWARALLIFDRAESAAGPCARDTVSFNAALSALEKGARWREALELLRELGSGRGRAEGLRPTAVSWNAAASACEKGSQWRWALALLDPRDSCAPSGPLRRAGRPAVDAAGLGVAAGACMRAARWACAVGLLQELRRRALGPDLLACCAALRACEASGQAAQGGRVLRALAPGIRARGGSPAGVGAGRGRQACAGRCSGPATRGGAD
ncbi:unnamed protein product [Prorocentrum cordatum]|uniref:Pentatricopeptide repeat-containing protein, chloroplastic n=1 Tax=Prorocentrum cordatum TaxID=2364126 RepID=A0ABN9W544_9DINO|nr:unnamed protein product [Polarella glacialis]